MTTTNDGPDGAGTLRLNRFLAQCGLGSRRACDDIIAAGHIYCNGKRVATPGVQVHPGIDRIEYMGNIVKQLHALEYIAYYKPREVMVTTSDPEGRITIYDAIKSRGRSVDHLRYAGRLDYQSEGLLLLTNDGDLIHALTHPRFHLKKVYHVKAERCLTDDEIGALLDGVESEGQCLKAGAVKQLSLPDDDRKQFWYEIELFEGKNRQIRRMFEALSILVGRIRRVQFGSVVLGKLTPGEYRPLTEKEIASLKNTGFKIPRKKNSPRHDHRNKPE
jgi:23S rRNA pseudouridine2605 synthase